MNNMKKGTGIVYLVGAGPGHPGLITMLGHRLLQECDAVVYDDLIPYELVSALPAKIERHYVGKRAGRHSTPQNETSDLLVELAKRGLKVVRLKGGDPLVFARGGEEATILKKSGIPFQIIPGVTAVTACASGTGIPLTDRRNSAWLLIATGKEASSASLPVPWEQIAALRGGTFAVYMGVGALQSIVDRLISSGADPDTPSAVVVSGYTGMQRVVTASISELPRRCREENVESPAIVIVGEVVNRMREIDWMIPGVLAGKRILVTRPTEFAPNMCDRLRVLGAEPLMLPTIAIAPFEDQDGWINFLHSLRHKGWLIFTSRSGVIHLLDGLLERGFDLRDLSSFKIAAIGPGTADELARRGLKADFTPDKATVASLAEEFASRNDLTGAVVVRVRGDLSDDTIERALSERSINTFPVTVYRTITPAWEPHWIASLQDNPPDYITFSSSSTVDGFVKILGKDAANKIVSGSTILSIGPSTSKTISKYGWKVTAEADPHTQEGLVEKLVEISGSADVPVDV